MQTAVHRYPPETSLGADVSEHEVFVMTSDLVAAPTARSSPRRQPQLPWHPSKTSPTAPSTDSLRRRRPPSREPILARAALTDRPERYSYGRRRCTASPVRCHQRYMPFLG